MKSFYSLLIVTATLILTSLSAPAAQQQKIHLSAKTKKHLSIASVEVIDETEKYADSLDMLEYNYFLNKESSTPITDTLNGTLDQVDLIVDKVINIGQKIWAVVEKGRPVSSYTTSKATALPANALRWDQLENWQAPKSKVISVVYKNMYGIEVVKFTYRIILLYGGSVNGVGKYIGYASVEPLEMTTAYMYTFNASATVDTVFNMGTSKDPLAAMVLNIKWTVETVLKKSTVTHTYTLDGLGNITTPTQGLKVFNNLQ